MARFYYRAARNIDGSHTPLVTAGSWDIPDKDKFAVFKGYNMYVTIDSQSSTVNVFAPNFSTINVLINKGNNKVINTNGAGYPIFQWQPYGLPVQEWQFEHNGAGWYKFIHNINQKDYVFWDEGKEQIVVIDKWLEGWCDIIWNPCLLPDGSYAIACLRTQRGVASVTDSNDDGQAIVLTQWTGNPKQRWQIVPAEQATMPAAFKLADAKTGKIFDDAYRSKSEGAGVIFWTDNDNEHQKWIAKRVGNFITLQNKNSQLYLTAENRKFVQRPLTGADNQLFCINVVEGQSCVNTYSIYNKEEGLFLGADGTGNGAHLILLPSGEFQTFNLKPTQ